MDFKKQIGRRLVRLYSMNSSSANAIAKHNTVPAWMSKADPEAGRKFIEHEQAIQEHAGPTANFWRKVSLYVALPVCVVMGFQIYHKEKAHLGHLMHELDVPDDQLPAEYEYQNVRTKRFFWGDGDKTLFWNDKVNKHRED